MSSKRMGVKSPVAFAALRVLCCFGPRQIDICMVDTDFSWRGGGVMFLVTCLFDNGVFLVVGIFDQQLDLLPLLLIHLSSWNDEYKDLTDKLPSRSKWLFAAALPLLSFWSSYH